MGSRTGLLGHPDVHNGETEAEERAKSSIHVESITGSESLPHPTTLLTVVSDAKKDCS